MTSNQDVDYTTAFCQAYPSSAKNIIGVFGRDRNVLILIKQKKSIRRFDGHEAVYELEYRWLSRDCCREDDEAWCATLGSEFTYWQRKEIPAKVFTDGVSLFDVFNLTG